jgi:ABC-type Fe3+ transport system permease subunit
MNLDLRPYLAVWAFLAVAVLVLYVRRRMVSAKEDDNLHVMSGANPDQVVVAAKLDAIDKWGKILTVITVLFGLAIAFLYVYSNFIGRNSLGE